MRRSGLVQQTVQIVASLRSHDLTLFVRLQRATDSWEASSREKSVQH
jgi:hypothetical protein